MQPISSHYKEIEWKECPGCGNMEPMGTKCPFDNGKVIIISIHTPEGSDFDI